MNTGPKQKFQAAPEGLKLNKDLNNATWCFIVSQS